MSTPDVHPALLADRIRESLSKSDRELARAVLDRALTIGPGRSSIQATPDPTENWSAICRHCSWRRDDFPSLGPAETSGHSHAAVAKLETGKQHRVFTIGQITVIGPDITV